MKKLILAIPLVAFMLNISAAQEAESNDSYSAPQMVSKKGFNILPEKGDFALGFDAVPLVNFALNAVKIMDNTGDYAQHPGYVSGFSNVIVGKYFLKDNMAIRGKFGLNTYSEKLVEYFNNPADVFNFPGEPDKWNEIKDVETEYEREFYLGLGLEFRRGHNRLQGFYGGELILGIATGGDSYKYGVEMNEDAINNGYENADGSLVSSGRTLKRNDGFGTGLGVRGFVGVEYFVAPKISLAAEFGWGLGLARISRGSVKTESWNTTDGVAEIETNKGNYQGSAFVFAVDDGAGMGFGGSAALSVLFHF